MLGEKWCWSFLNNISASRKSSEVLYEEAMPRARDNQHNNSATVQIAGGARRDSLFQAFE